MTLGRKYQYSSGNAGDARKVYASQSKASSLSACSSSISLCDMIEPPDWEALSQSLLSENDPLAYPENDVEVAIVPRKIRTIKHVQPDEDISKAPLFVRDCIRSYTSDFTVVNYKYRQPLESMAERVERLLAGPRHQYECDTELDDTSTQLESQPSSGRQSVSSVSSSSSCNETLTPQGSWASLDLRSSTADPLLPDIFEKRTIEQIDSINETKRMEGRQPDFLGLYAPYLDEEEAVERRLAAEMPCEVLGHRILVTCLQLKLELDVEPLFASMALYDAKEKRKLSENFYFNMNSDSTRQMLIEHTPHADVSTLSRSAIFDIQNPTPDVFLVVRVEKVLQGDVNECIEPYIKDDKNREKVRSAAQAACSRLGKFRMPLAWTAVALPQLLGHQDDAHGSLDRKASTSSLEQLRRRAGEVGGSLSRKGSVERRAAPRALLPPPAPTALTVTSFFKQETDKLRDEDLYKFLSEIKRPSSAPRKLKCVPGSLRLEVAPCPEDLPNALTPELAKLRPYGDDSVRPTKEVLPFPSSPPLQPHTQYRNLLFVTIREVNLTNYTGRSVSARNIAVRVQLLAGEGPQHALPVIFGRSSCPELSTEAHTTVLYHNKNPCLYDELKIKLPADLGDQHHLLFTVLHVACQRKPPQPDHEKNLETVLGYTWVPLCRNGRLTCGEQSLPVMLEPPPDNYSYIFPDVLLPGTRWIDNHKPIFNVVLDPYTTVHPMDAYIERFAMCCEAVEEGNIPARIGVSNMETELRTSISELSKCSPASLARLAGVLLPRLLQLLCAPPPLPPRAFYVAQDAFHAFNALCLNCAAMNDGASCDAHGRSAIITSFIQYQAALPRPPPSDHDVGLPLPPSALSDGSVKLVHEELVLQWVVASGATRDLAMQNSWALFELIIKSLVEYLWWSGAHEAPRAARLPVQFTDDLTTLVNNIVAEIISRYGKDSRLTSSLNNSLAFFLRDLLSVADRGLVLGLLRAYCKQIAAKLASLPRAVDLLAYKLSFLRIICSHEHYVSLCLPPPPPQPEPSSPVHSRASHSSSAAPQAALSHQYRSTHYLSGLLLSELNSVLHIQSPALQSSAVNAVLSLLASHDADPRLARREVKARCAALYLPLLDTLLEARGALQRPHEARDLVPLDTDNFSQFYSSPTEDYNQSGRVQLSSETSRALLVSVTWVVRWAARAQLAAALGALPAAPLLHAADAALHHLQYPGRRELSKCQPAGRGGDVKARLEDAILGQGSARSDFILRRKGGTTGTGKSERWRKDWSRGGREGPAGGPPELAGELAAESALAWLQVLEIIIQTHYQAENGQAVCTLALQVLLRALQRNQSALVLQHMLATLRALIVKVGSGAWAEHGALWLCVVARCAGSSARAHAAGTLYALMRDHYTQGNNFSRVKMQVTMSLSSLVGTARNFSEDCLRRALRTVLTYAERDRDLAGTSFPEQVKELVFNLHMILSDTVKMQQFQQDPEMLQDLMHRVARGYQHSPHLRLTWLSSMAQKHMERSNHAEAGMCLVHGAALVAEVTAARGRGAALLLPVSHNVLDESACDAPPHAHLSHTELQALLEHAASEFMLAGMYETVNEVYKVLIPIAEENRDYKKLANIHSKLNEAFTRIDQLVGKRVFGAYFRVGFYGARFGDLHAQQFVYKEHALTKLPEIFSRLENFYGQRFGAENVVIIKESTNVDVATLDPDKAYLQITYVEPHWEPHELRRRTTHAMQNHNIKRFIYATPFTTSGRAHGDIAEQCKRKTILTTAHHFPYVKTRIQVVQRTQIILSPIEVAIEDIQKKTAELAAATSQEPADPKMLQMVVQGCIGTTVNQGPLELAQVFLAPIAEGTQPPTRLSNKLRLAFKDFSKKCQDALKKNKNLIGSDQREYQRELERNLQRFTDSLAPLVRVGAGSHAGMLANGTSKPDYKLQA